MTGAQIEPITGYLGVGRLARPEIFTLRNPQLRPLPRGGVCSDRLPAPEFRDIPAVTTHHEVGEQAGPACLMRRSEPLTGVGVEVFIEQEKILPVRRCRER